MQRRRSSAKRRLTPASLRNATVGLVGMGRIGQAIARRLEAFQVKVVYHSRKPQSGVTYKHYPDLVAMDCMSYTPATKAVVHGWIKAPILLALTATSRVLRELLD